MKLPYWLICSGGLVLALVLFLFASKQQPPPPPIDISFPFPPKPKTKQPTRPTNLPIPGTPDLVPHETDCMVRMLAFDFSKRLISERKHFKTVYDALSLDYCPPYSLPPLSSTIHDGVAQRSLLEEEITVSVLILYCDDRNGKDSHSGSKTKPLKTLSEALKRVVKAKASKSQIILREGTFFIPKPLVLTTAHSQLTIRNYAAERAVLSGAQRVKIKKTAWIRIGSTTGENKGVIWKTNLNSVLHDKSLPVEGLRLGNVRMVRAKTPNGHPEQSQHARIANGKYLDKEWFSSEDEGVEWDAPKRFPVPEKSSVLVDSTNRDWPKVKWADTPKSSSSSSEYDYVGGMGGQGGFQIGNNGAACSRLHPKTGYFCTVNNRLAGAQASFRAPAGVKRFPVQSSLGHQNALVVAWNADNTHAWTFQIETWSKHSIQFKDSTVGIQGAIGADAATNFYVENLLSALDSPGEFYIDPTTHDLYVCLNTTQLITGLEDWGLVQNKELIRVQSTSTKQLVKNLNLIGLEFRDTALTWLDPHGSVSGGDWTLPKVAAVSVFGVDQLRISECIFERLDGTALLLHGYARNVVIEANEFAYLGASAVVSIGTTSTCLNSLCSRKLESGGPDGRPGEQPRGTKINQNVFRELGVFVKQSSAYFSALSGQSVVTNNLMFNLPKSAMTFHDGFLGGDVVERNLVFNTAKETLSAPIDLVDRVPYIWEGSGDSGATTVAQTRTIRANFIIANNNCSSAIATRDGTSSLAVNNNVLVYGSVGLKPRMGGHSLRFTNNLFVHLQSACFLPTEPSKLELKLEFSNNTCLLTGAEYGYGSSCPSVTTCKVRDNRVSTLFNSPMRISCQNKHDDLLTDYLKKHQDKDPKTQVLPDFPSNEQITSWIRKLLSI